MSTKRMMLAFGCVALLAGGCSKDPSKDKPKAKVENAKPEPPRPDTKQPEPPKDPEPTKPAAPPDPAEGKLVVKAGDAAKAGAAKKGAAVYNIAPDSSQIAILASKPSQLHTIKFNAFKGMIAVPGEKAEEAYVEVEIDMTSIEADDPKLTGHLKSPDFFEVEKYPKATFVVTSVTAGGEGGASHTITGNLQMKDVKKSISFPANVELAKEGVKLKAEFAINRKDWGIVYPGMPDDLIRDNVVIGLNIAAAPAK
jgi:polyisoprenoid-binding protein YceI